MEIGVTVEERDPGDWRVHLAQPLA